MTLSRKTFDNLANALAPEVIEYIYTDEKWIEFLSEIVPEALKEKLGELDIELEMELVMAISDRILMKSFNIEGN